MTCLLFVRDILYQYAHLLILRNRASKWLGVLHNEVPFVYQSHNNSRLVPWTLPGAIGSAVWADLNTAGRLTSTPGSYCPRSTHRERLRIRCICRLHFRKLDELPYWNFWNGNVIIGKRKWLPTVSNCESRAVFRNNYRDILNNNFKFIWTR